MIISLDCLTGGGGGAGLTEKIRKINLFFIESMDKLQRRPSESIAMMTRNIRCLSRLYLKLEV